MGKKRFYYRLRDWEVLLPASVIWEGPPETLLCYGDIPSLGKPIKERSLRSEFPFFSLNGTVWRTRVAGGGGTGGQCSDTVREERLLYAL